MAFYGTVLLIFIFGSWNSHIVGHIPNAQHHWYSLLWMVPWFLWIIIISSIKVSINWAWGTHVWTHHIYWLSSSWECWVADSAVSCVSAGLSSASRTPPPALLSGTEWVWVKREVRSWTKRVELNKRARSCHLLWVLNIRVEDVGLHIRAKSRYTQIQPFITYFLSHMAIYWWQIIPRP